jgi:hypothetical protein
VPLSKYAPFFGPDDLGKMATAFDAAWDELSALHGINLSTERQIALVRTKLAECIVMSAMDRSTLSPEWLAQEALRCLAEDETHIG